MAGQPVVFRPGAVCPEGYLCIPGMEPIQLPDVQPDIPDIPDVPVEPSMPPLVPSSHSDLYVDNPYDPNLPIISADGYDPVAAAAAAVAAATESEAPPTLPEGYDPAWDTMDIPAGASFDVRSGLLPTSTPTFNIHNPYYGDDYIAERGYSGSSGWTLPGGSGVNAPSGSFDPFNPWGGEDMQYDIGNQYSDEPAFGTNLTPYDDRWFIENTWGLLPESYGGYVNLLDYPGDEQRGRISEDAGLVYPTISSSYDIQPPSERILWGSPYTVTSDVDMYSDPEFVHPYYDWLNSGDAENNFMDGLLNSLDIGNV